MNARWDSLVIGSGFGGAVAACRLAQAGHKVLVLERGRRWTPKNFPREPGDAWLWSQEHPERHSGWADLRRFDNMWVAAGAGVGGGSLIYASVSVPAPAQAFARGWPAGLTRESLAPYDQRVAAMLEPQTLPDGQHTARLALMQEAAQACGWGERFHKVPLAVRFDPAWHAGLPDAREDRHAAWHTNAHGRRQGTCVHCGNCDIGCQVQAKNTLDLNYLADAENRGAEIRPLHLVQGLEPLGGRGEDGRRGWLVHVDRIAEGRRHRERHEAARVIVAAGSIGSTELLLRSRDLLGALPRISPRLGQGWAFNGDFVTPSFHAGRAVSPSHGPTIAAAIDLLDGAVDGQALFIEDGGVPNLAHAFVRRRLRRPGWGPLRRLWRELARTAPAEDPLAGMMPWFGQGVDAGDGRLFIGRHWYAPWRRCLKLDWHAEASRAMVEAMVRVHRQLSQATGGQALVPPTWTLLSKLITPHPLGGCNMADDPARGVVDGEGRVHGYQGLYVMDGASIPVPLGLNPSRTIAALAEHHVEKLLARSSQGIDSSVASRSNQEPR